MVLYLLPWGVAPAQFHFQFDQQQSKWTLENGVVRAVFQLAPEGAFEFLEIRHLASGEAWLPPEDLRVSPIRLQVGTRVIDRNATFRLVQHWNRAINPRGWRQTIVLDETQSTGRLTLEFEMFENQPVLRYRVRYQNREQFSSHVRAADMLPWRFRDEGLRYTAFYVNQWVKGGSQGNFEPITRTLIPAGPLVQVSSGAHGQHCTWLALRDTRDRGLFFGWEFDGRATILANHSGLDQDLQFTGQIDELNRPVQPNEQFSVPAAFIGLFHGDWDEAGYRTQRFLEAAVARPLPGPDFPYVMWNSWKYQTGIDEQTLRQNAVLAAGLGAEVFVVDLGWSTQIGDWHADPRKFPGGMRALSDFVHSLGMKFGLHFPLAEAARSSPVLQSNPDWTSTESYGYFDALSLCLSHRPVRDWVVAETIRMIDEYKLDWIVQDGENMVKRCTKTTHTHDPMDSNYSNAVDGLNTVIGMVRAQRPQVYWENCEDGGNMMTFNMVRNYVTSITSDDSPPLTTRQAIFGATYPFPPRYTDRYMGEEFLDTYMSRSYLFGGPLILMLRLPDMTPGAMSLLARDIQFYKKIRTRIRDGKVYHLTGRPARTGIDAIQSYHEASDTAYLFVYRHEALVNSRQMRLRGLKPDTIYRVSFQDDIRVLSMSGRQLMDQGVRVDLPSMWSAEVVSVEPFDSR